MAEIVKKRAIAYLIDILIISLLLLIVFIIFLNEPSDLPSINYYNEALLRDEITVSQYFNEATELYYQVDLEQAPLKSVGLVLIIIFFIIIPFYWQKTIGQAINGLKIKSKKLTLNQLFIRATVVNALAYSLLTILLLYFTSGAVYFSVVTILALIQLILYIMSGFMVLLKEDHKGWQDIWSKTEIAFEEEEK